MEKVAGIIGLGIMGGAIARNLVERGWSVVAFEIDAAKCDAAKSAGVEIATSPADVARRAPVIMTSLPSPKAAFAVAEEIAGSGAAPRILRSGKALERPIIKEQQGKR